MNSEIEWFVMDGRALFDTDAASIFEACGQTRPSMKKLRRDWGDMEACLCMSVDCGPIEFVEVIK